MFAAADLAESLDEKLTDSGLPRGDLHHVLCAVAIALKHDELLHFCIASVKYHDLPTESMYEVLLQSHLFLGFPAMIEALRIAHQVCPLPQDVSDDKQSESGDHRKSGEELCSQIYREHYSSLVKFTDRLHPALTDWMIEHGYGRVLSRVPLSPQRREIAILSILMITGYERQLMSHVRGFSNLGGEPNIVWDIFDIITLFIDQEQREQRTEILRQVV